MPKYSSYPPVTTISDPDVILFHKDSSNSEVIITFQNLEGKILSSLPVSSLAAMTAIAGTDNLIIDNAGTIKKSTFTNLMAEVAKAISFDTLPAVVTPTAGDSLFYHDSTTGFNKHINFDVLSSAAYLAGNIAFDGLASVTTPAAADTLYIHQSSSNQNKRISISDLAASDYLAQHIVYDTLPAVTIPVAGDSIPIHQSSSGLNKHINFDSLSASTYLAQHLQLATSVNQGAMGAGDKALLDTSTPTNAINSLVKRDGTGACQFVTIDVTGGATVQSVTAGGTGTLTADHVTFSGGGTGTIAASTSLSLQSPLITTTGKLKPARFQPNQGVSGLPVIDNLYLYTGVTTLVGGSPTENFNIAIINGGFSVKPNWGIIYAINPHITTTFLVADAGNNTGIAIGQAYANPGGNLSAGSYSYYAAFAYLTTLP